VDALTSPFNPFFQRVLLQPQEIPTMSFLRRTLIAAASVAVLGASFAAVAQDIKPRLIRFGYGLNQQSNQGRAAKVFADEVARLSGGKMKVRAIGAAALGPDNQMQQALIGGAQEMMVGSTATLVGITKEMALWDTPFLISNVKEADTLLDGPIGDKVRNKLPEKGLVGLVYWENGFRNLTNSKRAITKMEDLQGIKLRVMQNNVFLNSFQTLGANAIPLAFSELFSALETKTVDGQENPFNTILSSKFYEVQKYLMLTQHMLAVAGTIMSEQTWNSLSAEDQEIVEEVFRFEADRIDQIVRDNENALIDEVKKAGMTVVDKIDTKPFRDRVGLVLERNPSWVELYNQIQQIPD